MSDARTKKKTLLIPVVGVCGTDPFATEILMSCSIHQQLRQIDLWQDERRFNRCKSCSRTIHC